MAPVNVRRTLTGGDPRSLGQADDVVRAVLGDRLLLGSLIECVFDDDPMVRMRASDALEKICRREPSWLVPHSECLLTEMAAIDQPSVRWHVAQMLARIPLTPRQRASAVAILEGNLTTSSDWLVLNHSLEAMAEFVREDPTLAGMFDSHLARLERCRLHSVARRAARLRRDLLATMVARAT